MYFKLFLPVYLILLLLWPATTHASMAEIDLLGSLLGADKTNLKADGIDNTLIVVTIKDTNFAPRPDKLVSLRSSRGGLDLIRAEKSVTDIFGKAYFRISSLRDGQPVYSAMVDGQTLTRAVTVTFGGGLSFPLKTGDLIKIPDDGDTKTLNDTAVYYYASDGRRYVFPNEKVYSTWYANFSSVKIIPIDQMSLIPIGGNVTYKPGSKLVKFQTDAKTYLVTKGGVLRWAKLEEVARGWFGPNWNHQVDDISEAFYINYTFGRPVESALDLVLDIVRATANTIDDDKGLST